MDLKDIAKGVLEFVEKLLDRASLWFWLCVALVALLLLDAKGYLLLNELSTKPRVMVFASAIVLASLWIGALKPHLPLARLLSAVWARVAAAFGAWRRGIRASKASLTGTQQLVQILRLPCTERRWLVWFLYFDRKATDYLPYGAVQVGEEFKGVRSLLRLGVLNRTGDEPLAAVFLHKTMAGLVSSELGRDSALRGEIERERQTITENGKAALSEALPDFLVARFHLGRTRTDSEATT